MLSNNHQLRGLKQYTLTVLTVSRVSNLKCGLAGFFAQDLSELLWAALIAQLVKNPPTIQETLVRFLGWEDPLEKG